MLPVEKKSPFILQPSSLCVGSLLNIAYLAVILSALPWLLYQRLRHAKYREGWRAKLWGDVPWRASDKPCIWLHAVSVGEVNLLAPLIDRWQRLHPDWDIVVSA